MICRTFSASFAALASTGTQFWTGVRVRVDLVSTVMARAA